MLSTFHDWVDLIYSWLWLLSEESFWMQLCGERLFNLLTRYFGNDVVLCGMLFYITPKVTAPFNTLISTATTRFYGYWYSTIKISQKETIVYTAIQSFVASQLSEKDFRNVEARVVEEVKPDDCYDDNEAHQQPPKLELFPADKQQEFYYKGHKIWVKTSKEQPDSFKNGEMYSSQLSDVLNMVNQVNVMSITMKTRQTALLHKFLEEWIEIQHEKKYGKMTIYKSCASRYMGSSWIQVGTKVLRSFDSVLLKKGQKEKLLSDIQLFRQREKWYAKLGLPYRRGYLLRGPPGTGKTSLVQSIASKLKMNVAILSITSQMDDELIQYLLRTMPHNSILLIEDIDHCEGFKSKPGKDNVSKDAGQPQLSMTGILNALDGVTAQEGSMIFMSCNNMDEIEPAMLRPGRIDIKLELGYADRDQIMAMYDRFMNKLDVETDDDRDDEAEFGVTTTIVGDHLRDASKIEPSGGIALDDHKMQASLSSSGSSTGSISSTVASIDDVDDKGIESDADRFANVIPPNYVTPAELQNFFICHLDTIQAHSDPVQCVVDLVPAFLETVKADREHAEQHKQIAKENENKKDKKAGDKKDDKNDDDGDDQD